MAGKKRKVQTQDILTKDELLLKINSMPSLRDRALACFIYLSGCRISEIVGCKKRVRNKNKLTKEVTFEEPITIKPMTKENIEVITEKNLMLIHNVACLKRRKEIPRRVIPIAIREEWTFCDIFLQYYNTLSPGAYLFPITRERAWQIMNTIKIFNHFLIHQRCHWLVVRENFNPLDLKQFRGWSNTKPAEIYTHLSYQDLARKMGAKP